MTIDVKSGEGQISGRDLLHRLRWLIFHAWNIPPVFGLSFILLIGVLKPSQMIGILTTPLEPAYILGWLAFSVWFLPRQMRPLADWLDGNPGCSPESAVAAVRRFPLIFWATFLIYLAAAPASVIMAAERYTDFVATPYDWFRIQLVALIVAIIVGLPIFFLIFDLFGRALGAMKLSRPIVTIRVRVFLIGALIPLLIDTMLVQYYWTRTGYFTFETFSVWLLLEMLAICGSLIFAHSFAQALRPLQSLIGVDQPLPDAHIMALQARSTDEIGVLTGDYRELLKEQWLQAEILELNNRLLRSAGGDIGTAAVFKQVVELCREAVDASQAFVLVFDQTSNELVGVIQTGSDYSPQGYYRLRLDETSLAVWAFKQGQSVAVADTMRDPRVSPRMSERFNVRSALAAPLRLNDSVIGVLMAVMQDRPRAYGAREIALIEGLAREAAYALNVQQLREARVRAEAAYLDQQEQFGLLLNATAEGIFGVDNEGICTFVNPSCLRMLGYERQEDLVGKPIHALIHHTYPDGRPYPPEQCRVRRSTREGRSTHVEDELHWRADGSSFPVEFWSHPIYHEGRLAGAVVTFIDITERKRAEAELRVAASAFESQLAMMITGADGVILRINNAFTEITGYSAEEIVGQTPELLQSGRHDKDFFRAMWECVERTGGWQGEVWARRKNGEVYPKWLTVTAVRDATGDFTHYIYAHHDISERKVSEEKINELAFFDQLTGLPNRVLLIDRLRQTMAASARDGNFGALLFLDLDNFKTLNDTLGHDIGDLLLKQVAQRLSACVREVDTVARLGGDEFVVMLTGLSKSEKDAASHTETIAEKIRLALNQIYQLGRAPHYSTSSIGVTLFKGQQIEVEDLMKQADLAMYKSKAAGRNTVRMFDLAMETSVLERVALETDLRHAIDGGQFLLYYQAQVEGDGRPTGAEVLLRWQHPQRGLVPPAAFIPAAEESGLILPLGRWVLQTACAQLTLWASRPESAQLTVAVNVSAYQFHQPDFVDQVLEVLNTTGANPQRLKLELTESLLVDNLKLTIEKMFALKAKGVGFSLDDFGTGFSSLSYLRRMPLDQLKIDQSFVRDVLNDPNDAAIARTIVALADSLGLGVIAEGVETAAQRDFLASAGCHAFQGYFFSRPLPLEDFETFVQRV